MSPAERSTAGGLRVEFEDRRLERAGLGVGVRGVDPLLGHQSGVLAGEELVHHHHGVIRIRIARITAGHHDDNASLASRLHLLDQAARLHRHDEHELRVHGGVVLHLGGLGIGVPVGAGHLDVVVGAEGLGEGTLECKHEWVVQRRQADGDRLLGRRLLRCRRRRRWRLGGGGCRSLLRRRRSARRQNEHGGSEKNGQQLLHGVSPLVLGEG